MKKIFIYTIFLILSFNQLRAEFVNDIKIEGNKRVSDETIIIYGELEKNKDYSEKDLDKVLKNLFSTDFFKDININITNKILKISVKEYPIISQLTILGEPKKSFREQIIKIMDSKQKTSFINSKLSNDIEKIKQLYSSVGYNFAKIESKFRNIDESNIDLVIEIERGNESKIISINFLGDKKVSSKRLRSVIASEEDKFWKIISKNTKFNQNLIDLDERLLKNYYKSIGYRDVEINSNAANISEIGDVNLVYSIDAGKRYTINKISTNLDKVYNQKTFFPLNKVYKKYIGDYYSPFKIKKILTEIDTIIEDNDLQFVEHNVEEVISENSINLVFNIFEGEKFLIERIDIVGNNITNEDVIRGELLIDEGDPFTELALQKSIAEIQARNIFRDVNYEVEKGSENNLKKINISVEERPTGEISAGAGIGTNGGTFAFNIQENNWLGEGKRVGIELELDEESILGVLTYKDPNYNFLGNSISYSISSESNDRPDQGYENSTYSASLSTSFEQYKDIRAALGLLISFDDLRTDNTASSSLKKQSGNFTELTGNYGFSFDRRDRAFMPTSGSIISFNQSLPIFADSRYISNTLSMSKYNSFTDDVVGSAKFYLSAVNGIGDDDVRLNKRKGLSSKRLRGFAKNKIGPKDGTDYIGGNFASSLNFETNLPNILPEDLNTDLLLFLDFGNVWGVDYDSTLASSNKIRSSTGIAANWLSPLGPITFTLSQNLLKADTDETESFNFNLGTTF